MDYDVNTISGLTRLGTRKAFGKMICEVAKTHDDLIVLTADVAASANLGDFAKEFPRQFYNMGIAEQNMLGVASAMAKEGGNIFAVSFAPFAATRAYEAVRILVGYMHLNVKIVGLASGFSTGSFGNTHYCFEDIAIMKSIPGMLVLSPADCVEEMKCLEFLADYEGPAYMRLTGIEGISGIHKGDYDFKVDQIAEVKEGEDVAIIATGSVINECVRASRALRGDNISVGIFNAHTIKPFDEETVRRIAGRYKMIVSVEEHNVIGGLGSSIADVLAGMPEHPVLTKIGIGDKFVKAGDYSYLLDEAGMSAPKLRETISAKFRMQERTT